MPAPSPFTVFAFDRFRFDKSGRRLIRQDAAGDWQPVAIGARALDALAVLLERHGEVVPKDDIVYAVWAGTAVEDSNLTVQISALRRVLEDGRGRESCIQTVSGKGYRFISPVFREDERGPNHESEPEARAIPAPVALAQGSRLHRYWLAGASAIAALLLVAAWHGAWFLDRPLAPRLSAAGTPGMRWRRARGRIVSSQYSCLVAPAGGA
jgi:DNA-binding winged helix-turn-helix (wHTH) protein